MSYYLGKGWRAGARLVHSCRELYNDVNAAYLTGAVDVVVVRQRDGSLKSTPFHARFGKLGVLRTGDFKEVEIILNGETVDLPMVIDESGKVFFAQPKPTQTSLSLSDEDGTTENVTTGSVMTGSEMTGSEMQGTRGNEIAGNEQQNVTNGEVERDGEGGSKGERGNEGGREERERSKETDDIVIDMEQLALAEEASFEDIASPDSHVTKDSRSHDDHMIRTDQLIGGPIQETSSGPILEGTLILTPRRGSDTELETEKRDNTHRRRFTTPETATVEVNFPTSNKPSLPIPITISSTDNDPTCPPSSTAMFSSLPPDLGVLSDSALDVNRYIQMSSMGPMATALSDTEVEVKDRLSSKLWEWSATSTNISNTTASERRRMTANTISTEENDPSATGSPPGFWGALTGMLRLSHRRRYSLEEGIYLDAIDDQSMDPQQLSQFFPQQMSSSPEAMSGGSGGTCDVTGERGGGEGGSSGLGSSLTHSPIHPSLDSHQYRHGNNLDKLVSTLEGVALSLCGGLNQGNISEDAFQNSRVSFADFNSNPEILMDPKLVVRVRGKYYPWQVAAPMIMSAVVFLQPLPDAAQSKLQKKYMPKKRQSFWSFWGRRGITDNEESLQEKRKPAKSEGATPMSTPKKKESDSQDERSDREDGVRVRGGGREEQVLSSDEETPISTRPRQRSLKRRKFCLTNTPTSQQLASLDLKSGANEVIFSITTKFQGTTKAMCTIYLWDYHDKVVISDIDGTITRSDVAGQVLPLVGMDWIQNGVVELFNSVVHNGYKVLYLSSRAIGQAGYTKDFLRRVSRGRRALPDGPLFLTPSSLVTAFKKEVIEKKPYEFKIECLQQVRSLFPEDYCPLHAGFGNRSSDVKSYTQVGVPRSRIFSVNHKGHLRYEISNTFQSSYLHLMEFVDAQFPPIGPTLCSPHPISPPPSPLKSPPSPRHTREEYNTFNYWRDHIPDDIPFDLN